MKFKETPPENILNSVTALLDPYLDEVSPTSLVAALQDHDTSTNPENDLDPLLSKEKAARLLDSSPYTVRAWCQKGVIRGVKIGQQWRIPASEIKRLANGAQGGGAQ